mmetsp:Transcript_7527/g.18119  ORF Transcript_7527/g.18119 Transcript_7527/m.18119 type:complete len:93 (-) Transcript_7527:143-421(-)
MAPAIMERGVNASSNPKMTQADANNGSPAKYMVRTKNMQKAAKGKEKDVAQGFGLMVTMINSKIGSNPNSTSKASTSHGPWTCNGMTAQEQA